ncbi:MAG: thiamine diphosphokinase [Paracoccaceae bacterium]
MNQVIVQSLEGITLVGGGPVLRRDLAESMGFAPSVVAVDGGADRCLARNVMPDAVIGDFDSISQAARGAIPAGRQHVIGEQETTDFDKALRSVAAPFVLALGFVGARVDHGLAVFNTLVRTGAPCVVIGPRDVVFHAPRAVRLKMRAGERVSLFPLARMRGQSTGLEWAIDAVDFAPDGAIGTSNRAVGGKVRLGFGGPGMLVMLPRGYLGQAIAAVRRDERAG